MAQGTLTLFEEFTLALGSAWHDLTANTYKVMLVTEQVGGTPTIAAADATPDSTDYTEVSGSNYTAGGVALATPTYTEAGGTGTWKDDGGASVSWTQHATGPATIKTAVIYNTTLLNSGTFDAIGFIDMTADGTTAISLVNGDITITWGANILTIS